MMSAEDSSLERNVLVAAVEVDAPAKEPSSQAETAHRFLKEFNRATAALRFCNPATSFSGKTAILAIGHGCDLDQKAARAFLDGVLALSEALAASGALARTTIDWNQCGVVNLAPYEGCPPSEVPVGPGVDSVTELLAHCQAGEVMFSDSARNLMDETGVLSGFPLLRNDTLFTRGGVAVHTHSYDPTGRKTSALYNPHVPSHSYRRFASLPPIDSQTLQSFLANGLELELRRVVSSAYDSIIQVTKGNTFISSSDVLDVLTRVNYDPSDRVLVISRNDRPTGFWTQGRKKQYVKFLKGNAQLWSGRINQVRIWVFDETLEDDLMPRTSIFNELGPLHSPKTLYSVSAGLLRNSPLLTGLIFGVTISTKYGYAIISIPSTAQVDSGSIEPDDISELLWRNREYDDLDGPMKAIITADREYVSTLVEEFEALLQDDAAVCLR